MIKLSLKIALLFFVILMLDGRAFARTAGSLDPSFGTGGVALTNVTSGNVYTIAVQPSDGKILIAGAGGSDKFMLIRYTASGLLDTSFGENGVVRTQIFDVNNSSAAIRSLAIQPDGKIIAAGTASYLVPHPPAFLNISHITVVRYNPNGSLDTTFDGDGKATVLVNGNSASGEEVALQTDGKIVVAGGHIGNANNFAVVRFLANGSLDTSFDDDGIVTTAFTGWISKAEDVKIQPDGKIVAAGYTQSSGTSASFAAARYHPDGSLDDSFGNRGKIETNVNAADFASSLALQMDGKIILAGTTQIQTGSLPQFGMVRLNANGSPDSSFGEGGKVTTRFGVNAMSYDTVVQSDGRIIVVGEGNETTEARDFALVRYLPNGSLDTSFGGDGKVLTPLLRYERGTAVAIDSNGKILVTGETGLGDSSGIRFAVVRYNSQKTETFCDYDGDGKSDISVFRPSNGTWYLNQSTTGFTAVQFGISTDKLAPADFDGDGKTDIAIYRDGYWYLLRSSAGFAVVSFGLPEDIPQPADYDGDGKAEVAVFRPSAGTWFTLNLVNNQFNAVQFGVSTDKSVVADYDGDGRADYAVYRPENGVWYLLQSTAGFAAVRFGIASDKPVSADFDGDGKTDIAVFRPSTGGWYRLNSSNGEFVAVGFGLSEDKPAPADYDGDGRADLAVFRPSDGNWYLLRSTAGFTGVQFGTNKDVPTPNAFVR